MDFKKSYDEYVVKAKVLFPDATFWEWEKLPPDIRAAWERMYTPRDTPKAALSASAQARMTQMIEEVLEPAMKAQAQRNPEDFVYTPPEVWMQQVMNVGARVVNRAITIAHEEWLQNGFVGTGDQDVAPTGLGNGGQADREAGRGEN